MTTYFRLGSRYQKTFGTKNVCNNVVDNFDLLSRYCRMTQFQENEKNPFSTPNGAGGNQWVFSNELNFGE